MTTITAVLIALGLALLLLTVRRTQALIGILYEQGPWSSLRNLLLFFAAGYAVYLVLVILDIPFSRELLVAEVFFLAALFMFLVVRFSFSTIYSILQLDAVEQQRNLDPLTGLFSRDAILYLVNHEFWKAQRFGFPLSLVLADVDSFEQVNTAHGRQTGDMVLGEIAEQLKEDLRQGDLIGRFEEDAFLCVLPSTAEKGARITAERLRSRIRAVRFVEDEEKGLIVDPRPDQLKDAVEFSASVGVVTLETEMHTPGEAVAQVEEALRMARARGGNKVHIHRSEGDQDSPEQEDVSDQEEAPDSETPAVAG